MNNIPDFSNLSSDNTPWSELLAGYVLGDLSSDDMILVQQHLASNPSAIADVEELQITLGLLPLGLDDVAVPEQIKTNLFTSLPDRETPKIAEIRSIKKTRSRNSQRRWFAIAGSMAAMAIAALGVQSYQLQQEFSATRQELARLRESQEQLIARSIDGDRYQESIAFMRQSGSRMLTMTGSGSVSGASGNVVIVPEQNRAMLTVQKMPQPPAGKVYHLWAVVNNQKVACVQFVPEANGQVLMQIPADRWNRATQVVITVEPEQSESQPTGEMVMSGEKI
jgi:Anti-sigma-K factor rskA